MKRKNDDAILVTTSIAGFVWGVITGLVLIFIVLLSIACIVSSSIALLLERGLKDEPIRWWQSLTGEEDVMNQDSFFPILLYFCAKPLFWIVDPPKPSYFREWFYIGLGLGILPAVHWLAPVLRLWLGGPA